MKILRTWGWILVAAAVVIWGFGWISGKFSGHGIASMDNAAIMLTVMSIVCLLLAVTVLVIAYAIKQMHADK